MDTFACPSHSCTFEMSASCCSAFVATFAFVVHEPEIGLRLGEPLFGGEAIPAHRLGVVLGDTLAFIVHEPEIELRTGVALLGMEQERAHLVSAPGIEAADSTSAHWSEPAHDLDHVVGDRRGLAASKATERGRGQARAITRDDFAVILARAGEPRKLGRGMETAETAAERAQIDRAIAGVLFHAGLRRSEAADLRWGDVEPAASMPGALIIQVRTSKTNRDGEATDIRLVKNGAG